MRTISKYKDYYDNALAYGVDSSRVYVRKEMVVEVDFTELMERHIRRYYSIDGPREIIGSKSFDTYCKLVAIGFCGPYYVGYRFDDHAEGTLLKSRTLFDMAEIEAYTKALLAQSKVMESWKPRYFESLKRGIEQLKSLVSLPYFSNLFHELNTPLLLLPAESIYEKAQMESLSQKKLRYHRKQHIIVHPQLKDLEFYRVKNAFDCYQEISQFLYGVLTNNEDIADTLDDKGKVQSHGFDLKYGFRTRPNK